MKPDLSALERRVKDLEMMNEVYDQGIATTLDGLRDKIQDLEAWLAKLEAGKDIPTNGNRTFPSHWRDLGKP